MTEPLDPIAQVREALATELEDELVRLWLAGVRGPKHLATALARKELGPQAMPSEETFLAVKTCLDQSSWMRKLMWAKENLAKSVQVDALKACPVALQAQIELASPHNEDKRTRNSAAQFLLASAAGLSPAQKHEISGNEEFMSLFKEIFPKAVVPKEPVEAVRIEETE